MNEGGIFVALFIFGATLIFVLTFLYRTLDFQTLISRKSDLPAA